MLAAVKYIGAGVACSGLYIPWFYIYPFLLILTYTNSK